MMLSKTTISQKRTGRLLFLLACLANALIVILGPQFPTVDAPAHLYNAHLLSRYLQGNTLVTTFHSLNPAPVPNWTATALLVILRSFLPVFIVEKIMLLLYIAGLPLACQRLVKAIHPQAPSPWLVFPFTYTFMLFMGFYNFNLGVLFFVLALAFWIRHFPHLRPMHWPGLLLYGAILYFSHIFVFAAFVICILVYSAWMLLLSKKYTVTPKQVVWQSLFAVAALLPWIALSVVFIVTKTGSVKAYIPFRDLILQIRSMSLLITFNYADVEAYTKAIFYTLLFTCVVTALFRAWKIKQQGWIHKHDIWLGISALFLCIYLMVPDSDGAAGFMSVRVSLLFFLFLVTWLTLQPMPAWVRLGTILVILSIHGILLSYYSKKISGYAAVVQELLTVQAQVKENTLLLPVNNSGEWYLGHVSNYIGADNNVIVLENYECDTRYFPLLWNKKNIPALRIGNASNHDVKVPWISNPSNAVRQIEYVLVIGKEHRLTDTVLQKNLDEQYHKTIRTSSVELWALNN